MDAWLAARLADLGETPWAQALLAGLATFVLEDPATIVCGMLVAEGRMAFATAMTGLAAGIALGDLGLFLIGAIFRDRVMRWGWVSERHAGRARKWFERNLLAAIVAARFVPGSRLPTYVCAGLFGAPPWRFAAIAAGASIAWTFLLLHLALEAGTALGSYKWPAALGAVAVIGALQVAGRRRGGPAAAADRDGVPPVSYFEFWPPYVFYAPVAGWYLLLALRYRGWTLPMNSNPSIYSGGMIRESKRAILDLVPPTYREWFAPHVHIVRGPAEAAEADLDAALAAMAHAGLDFPVVAKPDMGQRGDGVRRIGDAAALRGYIESFPPGHGIVIQRLVPYDGEAGVLWYREPGDARGRIFSVTDKVFPFVIGDGERTLEALILNDDRARLLKDIYLDRHAAERGRVLDTGERFPLVFAGNHSKGCIFKNGDHLLTEALAERIEAIASSLPEFHFGRFDCRYRDADSFRRGEAFVIVEINGAGAEATHIWDASARLRDAYWTLFRQFHILFRIGAANRRRGHRPIGLRRFLGDVWAYRSAAARYPKTQ